MDCPSYLKFGDILTCLLSAITNRDNLFVRIMYNNLYQTSFFIQDSNRTISCLPNQTGILNVAVYFKNFNFIKSINGKYFH